MRAAARLNGGAVEVFYILSGIEPYGLGLAIRQAPSIVEIIEGEVSPPAKYCIVANFTPTEQAKAGQIAEVTFPDSTSTNTYDYYLGELTAEQGDLAVILDNYGKYRVTLIKAIKPKSEKVTKSVKAIFSKELIALGRRMEKAHEFLGG